MKFGTATVVERHQRPGTLQRVLLRNNFIVNGTYQDPYDISSVSLFPKASNVSPSSILDTSTQLIASSASATYQWSVSGDASAYTGASTQASAFYKEDDGRWAVVLDGVNQSAGNLGAKKYIEVWTAKMTAGSDWQVFINEFELFQDSVITTTENVLLRTKTRLVPNRLRLGEVVNLKVGTEVTVQNKSLSQSIRNMFNQSVISDAQFLIKKHNLDSNLPAWVTVLDYSDTSGSMSITSDNTMLYLFDTTVLTDGSITDLGAGTGTYSVEAKYTILGETIISPMMHFTVS